MMDWVGIKAITQEVFARLVNFVPAQVRFADESEGSVWTDDPHLEITVIGPHQVGQDEERRDDSDDNADLSANEFGNDGIVTVCGVRMFTLSVACESQVQNIDDPRCGQSVLSNLLTRLGRTTTVEALDPFYAISDWTDIRRVPYRDNEGRLINRYVLDLLCIAADNDVDDTIGAGGWIGEVIGTGTVADGNAQPLTVNYDVKESG